MHATSHFVYSSTAISGRATENFYEGIAGTSLGCHKSNVGIIMLICYITQTLCGITCPYWSSRFSFRTRIFVVSMLLILSIVGLAIWYGPSIALKDCAIPNHRFLHISRIGILCCVSMQAAASMVSEITLLQYLAFYHESCTNAVTTGTGLGSLIGATWALTISHFRDPWMSIICCLVFPIILMTTFFCILPPRKRKSDQTVTPILTPVQQLTEVSAVDLDHDLTGVTAENAQKTEVLDTSKMGALTSMSTILTTFYKYSIPAICVEMIYEFTRSGFVQGIWPQDASNFYSKNLWVYQLAASVGKASTNFMPTTKYRKMLFNVLTVGAVLGGIYFSETFCSYSGFADFVRSDMYGHWMVVIGLTIPMGFAYGAIIANTYFSIRHNIENEELRAFVLGNIAPMFVYGQIIGTVCALVLHHVVE